MASISRDEVLKLAKLSKLELTPDQVEKFRTEIVEIVEYVEKLQAVDTEGLEPTNQVSGLTNVMRKDEINDYSENKSLLKNLPDQLDGQIKVKRMIG